MRLAYERFYTTNLVKISRRRDCRRNLVNKRKHCKPLSAEQRSEILAYWAPFANVKPHLAWFEFYSSACDDNSQLKYYIPDPVHFSEIDTFFTSPRISEAMDDKNLYDLYFHDVKTPLTIMRKINGELLDKEYHAITREQALDLYAQAGNVLSKAARMSFGGHSIKFFDVESCPKEEFSRYLDQVDHIVIQEVISQHETLNRIHKASINTIRIMSLTLDGTTQVLSSVLRMGQHGARVDNASSGGIVCGITSEGTLKEIAYDHNGNKFTGHPQSGPLKGIKIEGYDKCCELVKQLAGRMCSASRLISWDFAIDPAGEPILIEVNLSFGELDFHQLCNGPIFGERTSEILSRVFNKSDKE